jgi:peptidoglycan-associated lipoprotein
MRVSKTLFLCLALVVAAPFSMTGCSKKKPDTDQAAAAGQENENKAAASEGMGEPESLTTPEGDAGSPGQNGDISEGRTSGPMLPVYFAFDSSHIETAQVSRIEHNADFLKENGGVHVRIEGNCDERGSREYNLALGERRAKAAEKYLINLGVDANRLTTVSWGEEKPLVYGQDEQSWMQNRRDDFVLTE